MSTSVDVEQMCSQEFKVVDVNRVGFWNWLM